jgi:uncharacterized protein (TIGR03435 family)
MVETEYKLPLVDETGLTQPYDFTIIQPDSIFSNEAKKAINVLLDKLGLEIVPARRPVEMLVVRKE